MATPAQRGVRRRWINALRSGEFKQTHGILRGPIFDKITHDQKYNRKGEPLVGHCCLGVLCELAVKAGVIKDFEGETLVEYPQVIAWVGLKDEDQGGVGSFDENNLAALNDGAGLTKKHSFKQIAKIIESDPEGLFV